MPASVLHAIVPALPVPDTYCGRLIEALRQAGCRVAVHRIPGRLRQVDCNAVLAGDVAMARLPDGATAIVDGTLLANLASAIALDARRLRLIVTVDRSGTDADDLLPEQQMAHRRLELGSLSLIRLIAVAQAATAAELQGDGIPADRIVVAPADTAGAATLLDLLSATVGLSARGPHIA